MILGAVLIDPFLSNKGDTRFILGLQYALTANLFLIIDGGANYLEKPEENTVSRGALQVNFLKDLYLRAGQYHDKTINRKGHSWGISWIGPRISLEYAYKISEIITEISDDSFKDEQIIETSLSFALIF